MTKEFDVKIIRPTQEHWPRMLEVLKTANFHHIGGPEMETFPLEDCFIALVDGEVRGVGGYRVLNETEAKTTLLAVEPEFGRLKLGTQLQDARLNYLKSIGIRSVTTNTDDPRVMSWIEKNYGFKKTGVTIPKVAEFGRTDADEWTNLRVDWTD